MRKFWLKPDETIMATRLANLQPVNLSAKDCEIFQFMGENTSNVSIGSYVKLVNESHQIILVPYSTFYEAFEKLPFGCAPLLSLLKKCGVLMR